MSQFTSHNRDLLTVRMAARLAVAPGAILAVLLLVNCVGAQQIPGHLKRLADFDIFPTSESVGEYLTSLHPSPKEREILEALVARLGDEGYSEREAATKQLLRRPAGVMPVLEEATKSADPEIRWRSKQILDHTERESRSLLHAVFTTIEKEKLPGLCRSLFGAAPLCKEEYLRVGLRRALVATVQVEDVPYIKEQLKSADAQLRIAAVGTLAKIVPSDAAEESLRLLTDESEAVQVAASRVLADQGRRESLGALVRLLDSGDLVVRTDTIRMLRALTGQHLNYTVYDVPEKRAAAVAAWQTWLAGDGMTADLRFPLAEVAVDLGRLLVCEMGQGKVIEFDAAGKKTWERQVGQAPWGCQGLPNGHRLVTSYQDRTVMEFDQEGNEVWRFNDLPGGPMSVQRLDNGNTLLACSDAMQIVEVSPDKKIVWKVTVEGRPCFARRLEDGRTLVAQQAGQKVVEVDTDGKTVWELPTGIMSFSADRTPAGTTLICDLRTGDVKEYDRDAKVIWSKGGFANPYTVQRLASGNTLVVDRTGVKEISPDGKMVKEMPMTNVYRAHRY